MTPYGTETGHFLVKMNSATKLKEVSDAFYPSSDPTQEL